MKRYKSGFTLAEVITTIFVIGIIAAITIPTLISVLPNNEERLRKKVTHLVEDTIAQMVNDDTMYPQNRQYSKQGFKNTDQINLNGEEYVGNTKFCKLFAHKFVSIDTEIDCSSLEEADASADEHVIRNIHFYNNNGEDKGEQRFVRTFRTHDQMEWYLPISDFTKDDNIIMVDINGERSGSNCMETDRNCRRPDIIAFYVRSNGTITRIKPSDPSRNPYTITIKKTCPPNEQQCGTYDIVEEGSDTSLCNGSPIECEGKNSKNTGTFKISGLSLNQNYVLKAVPEQDYYSNWRRRVPKEDNAINENNDYENRDNERKINLTGYDLNTIVNLKFYAKSKVSFYLHVIDCDENLASSCVSAELTKTGDNIGLNDNPQKDVIVYENLEPGDYKLNVEDHNGEYYTSEVKFKDGETCIESSNNNIKDQSIKIGSEDMHFYVSVVKGTACD